MILNSQTLKVFRHTECLSNFLSTTVRLMTSSHLATNTIHVLITKAFIHH